jgi:hypothetical protein
MQFHDSLTLDAPRLTKDGFMKVRAKAARAGVYDYLGMEVDPEAKRVGARDTVKVYRPNDEVFATDSVSSFIAKPVTNNHPDEPVNAGNWTQHARGVNMGALRDGDYLAFDLVVMDAALISDIGAGKRELSNGYSCVLDWTAGVTDAGEQYDAIQRNIRGNHIAVVDKGRAGHECAIKDSGGGNLFAVCDANPQAISTISNEGYKMKITLDGVSVTLTDASEVQAAFDKKTSELTAVIAAKDAETAKVVVLTAESVTKDAEIAKLTADLVASAITPAKLRDAAKSYADAQVKAKAFGVEPDENDSEDMIKKKVVGKAMGDKAKDYTADHIAIAFDALMPPSGTVVAIGQPAVVGDATTNVKAAQAARMARLSNAHRAA